MAKTATSSPPSTPPTWAGRARAPFDGLAAAGGEVAPPLGPVEEGEGPVPDEAPPPSPSPAPPEPEPELVGVMPRKEEEDGDELGNSLSVRPSLHSRHHSRIETHSLLRAAVRRVVAQDESPDHIVPNSLRGKRTHSSLLITAVPWAAQPCSMSCWKRRNCLAWAVVTVAPDSRIPQFWQSMKLSYALCWQTARQPGTSSS